MSLRREGRAVLVLGAVCAAGLGSAGAAAASTTVAWGTTSSAPAGALGELFGVAAASAADVLAVGGYNPGQPPTAVLTRPYAEHWNGTGWTATNVPLASVYPGQAAQLNGVADVAPGDGWAVGSVSDPSSLASQTLAYHWNGTAWQRTPTPNPGGAAQGNHLAAVAARAANDVWAVGGDGYPAASLVLHWDGSTWAQVRVPNVGSLDAVTLAPGHVWVAAGDQVERFNGAVGPRCQPRRSRRSPRCPSPAWPTPPAACGQRATCTTPAAREGPAPPPGRRCGTARHGPWYPPAEAAGCPAWLPRDRRSWPPAGRASGSSASPALPRSSPPR